MGAHHFFVDASDIDDDVVDLMPEDSHHAAHVLRLRAGDAITIADSRGRVYDAVVDTVSKTTRAKLGAFVTHVVSRPMITLFQAISKGDKVDFAIEKAVEVGVRRIVPFLAERSIVRWDDAKRDKAHRRWSTVALAAAKQCRAPWRTEVGVVASGVDSFAAVAYPVIALDVGAARRLRDVLRQPAPDELGLVIGPEGGLSLAEIASLEADGAMPATLGPRVLRTETAGAVAAAVVAFAYGSLG